MKTFYQIEFKRAASWSRFSYKYETIHFARARVKELKALNIAGHTRIIKITEEIVE